MKITTNFVKVENTLTPFENYQLLKEKSINLILRKTSEVSSYLVENLCVCLLKQNKNKYNIILFNTADTEADLIYRLHKIKIKTGLSIEEKIKNLLVVPIYKVERKERFDNVKLFIDKYKGDNNKLIVILNNVEDLVYDYFDKKEGNAIIDYLLNERDNNVTFLCIVDELFYTATFVDIDGEEKPYGFTDEIFNKSDLVIKVESIYNDDNKLLKATILLDKFTNKRNVVFYQEIDNERDLVYYEQID